MNLAVTAARWLRSGVAQIQAAAGRVASAPAVPSPADVRSSDTASTATETIDPPSADAQPDVTRFAPGGDQFVQPDQTTCGSSSLVMAKMINTPAYGDDILQTSDDTAPDETAIKARFDRAVLAMHATTVGWKDSAGTWQLPWPTQLGTPPWAVAREMSVDGGCGRPRTSYRTQLADPFALDASYDTALNAIDAGECVPLYIGNDTMARHVVLITGHVDDVLSIYDPSCGRWVATDRTAYVAGHLDVAGWGQPWFVVVPG